MAADYWASTQRRYWTYTRRELAEKRRKLEEEERSLIHQFPLPERRLFHLHLSQQMVKLGKNMNVRQQAFATAQVYMRRFYTRVEVRRTNPYLVMATALYLACKMEECPQHIRVVVGELHHSCGDLGSSDTSKLGECEFALISEMDSQLIVHHPYRTLTELQGSLGLTQEESAMAWSVVNDHYLTDLPLLHPPHVIAVTAIFLALSVKSSQNSMQGHATAMANAVQNMQGAVAGAAAAANSGSVPATGGTQGKAQNLVNWLAESNVDIEAVVECTQEMISLYEVWEQYNEKLCRDQIARFVKARGLDK